MKKKFLIGCIILFFFIYFMSADVTSDSPKTHFRDNTDYFMKFRGELSLVATYLFEYQDGVNTHSHFLPVNYAPLDYTDGGDPAKRHHTKGPGRVVGGAWGGSEVELYLNYHFIAPFLTADNFLMQDNNLKFSLYYSLSPITTNIGMGVTFTPLAFLNFEAGFLIGFGWNIPGFIAGLGYNDHGEIVRYNIMGPHMELWFASTFMFDLAVVLPKPIQKWTHIVFLAKPIIKYQALLSISEDLPYMLEEDPGENLGGWKLNGEFILGYQYTFIEDDKGEDRQFIRLRNNHFMITAGIYFLIDWLNLSHYFDSPMSHGWGSDFCGVYYGPAVQLDLPWNYYLKIFVLFKNERVFTDETVGNLDFCDRVYKDWNVSLRRIGFYFGWNF